MPVEQQEIINELNTEGIDVSLAEGISFETPEALKTWVGKAKTFTEKPKSLEDYTKEELETILKDPSPKAKGLQGLLDAERAKFKAKSTPPDPGKPKGEEEDPKIKALELQIQELKQGFTSMSTNTAEEKRNSLIAKETAGLEEFEVNMLKNAIPKDATEEAIKKQVSDYRNFQTRKGLKGYVTDGGGEKNKGELPADFKSAIGDFVKAKTKK